MLIRHGRRCISTVFSSVKLFGDFMNSCTMIAVRCNSNAGNIVKSRLPTVPIPEVPYHEYVWEKSSQRVNSVAAICGVTGKTVTFGELNEQSGKFRSIIHRRLGLKPGDVIAVILPNCMEYPSIALGTFESGVILTTINPVYTTDEIAHQLKTSGAKAAVTTPEKFQTVEQAVKKLNLNDFQVILTGKSNSERSTSVDVLSYEALMKEPLDSFKFSDGAPHETILIPYSSGTTGVPKGVCLTNRNLVSNMLAWSFMKQLDEARSSQSIVPIVLPMFHLYAFAIMMCSIRSGSKMIILPKLEEKTFVRALRDYKSSHLYIAPPLAQYMIVNQSIGESEMASLKLVISAAAPLAQSDIDRLKRKASRPLEVRSVYGATETSPFVVDGLIDVEGKSGSVGGPTLNTELKIVHVETGLPLGSDQSGEICIRGPQVMKGYLNNRKATEETIDTDGWFHTGDIGHYDSDNLFYVTDRLKELIKVKGFQVAPAEVEAALRTHPDVLDVGVVGAPDPKKGETPVAFIVLKDEVNLDVGSMKKFLEDRLTTYKIPSDFVRLTELPRSQTGKILRKNLRASLLSLGKNHSCK